MKIVVCDDSMEDLTEIEGLLTKYKERNPEPSLEIEQYTDAVRLYQKIQEKDFADIYILDMIMSENQALTLAHSSEAPTRKASSFTSRPPTILRWRRTACAP